MAFVKKTWKDRLVEFAGRRTLKRISGSADSQMVVDVSRNEGTVSQAGDAFSAANMNDLEQRIADEFSSINNNLAQQPQWIKDSTGKIIGYTTQEGGAGAVFPFTDKIEATLLYGYQGTNRWSSSIKTFNRKKLTISSISNSAGTLVGTLINGGTATIANRVQATDYDVSSYTMITIMGNASSNLYFATATFTLS